MEATRWRSGRLWLAAIVGMALLCVPAVAMGYPPTQSAWIIPSVDGAGQITISWQPSLDPDNDPVTYDLYRYKAPINATTLPYAELVAADLTATTVSGITGTADEIAQSYSWYYAVVAKGGAESTLSKTGSINPHSSRSSSEIYSCLRCHDPHVPFNVDPTTKDLCYYCHGPAAEVDPATDIAVRATSNILADFYDYSMQSDLRAVGSQHRSAKMEADATECDVCHTTHRSPYFWPTNALPAAPYDPLQSYRKLLRVQYGTKLYTYYSRNDNTAESTAFCFSCHGSTVVNGDGAADANMLRASDTGWATTAGDHNEANYATAAHGLDVADGTAVYSNDFTKAGSYPAGQYPQVQCLACHDKHASPADKLIAYRGAGFQADGQTTYAQAELCFQCHSSSGSTIERTAGTAVGDTNLAWNARDVEAEFAQTSHHPSTVPTGAPSAVGGTWIETTQADFADDLLDQTVATAAGAVELQPITALSTLIDEGFESGNFTANAWTDTGDWAVGTTNTHSGTYKAQVTGATGIDYFEKTFDTSGLLNPQLSFWWAFNGSGTDYFRAQYSIDGGTNWTDVVNTTIDQLTYTQATAALPPDPAVLLRFTCSENNTGEYARVDDIAISGLVATGEYLPTGTVTSPTISPAGTLGSWGILSYGVAGSGGIAVDLLDGAGNVLAIDVASGTNLAPYSANSAIKLRARLTGNAPVAAVASDDFNDNSFDTDKWNDLFINSQDPDLPAAQDALAEGFEDDATPWTDNFPAPSIEWDRNTAWSPELTYSVRAGNGVTSWVEDFDDGDANGWSLTGFGTTNTWSNSPSYSIQGGNGTFTATAVSPTFTAVTSGAYLQFYAADGGIDAGEMMYVDYSTDGGTSFSGTPLWTYDGTNFAPTSPVSVALPAGTDCIRLRVTGADAAEYGRWDDLRIAYVPTAFGDDFEDGDIADWTQSAPIVATPLSDNFNDGSVTDWIVTGFAATNAWSNSPSYSIQGGNGTFTATAVSPAFPPITGSATLGFYAADASLDTGEMMYVDWSADYGQTWNGTPLWTYDGVNAAPASPVSVTLPEQATRIRLRVTGADAGEYGRWDDITITQTQYNWTDVQAWNNPNWSLQGKPSITTVWADYFDDNDYADWTSAGFRTFNTWSESPNYSFEGGNGTANAYAESPVFAAVSGNATLRFEAYDGNALDTDEMMYVDYSTDGTTYNATPLWSYNGSSGTTPATPVTVALPAGTQRIRLRVTGADAGEYGRWDNVSVFESANDCDIVSPSFTALASPGSLSFDWQRVQLDTGETMSAEYSTDGGSTWTPLWTGDNNNGTTTTTGSESLALPAGTNRVRLRVAGINEYNTELGRWDNIEIATEPPTDELVSRAIDMDGWSNVTVSFQWQRELTDSGEYLYLDYSSDGGSNWTNLWLQDGAGNTVAGTVTGLAMPTASADTRIRLRVQGAEVGEYGYWDQIVVNGTPPGTDLWPDESSQHLTLRAEGAGFTGTIDQGEFTYLDPAVHTWISGSSFDARVYVGDALTANSGLMVRTGADEAGAVNQSAAFVGLWPTGASASEFRYRGTAGGAVATNGTGATVPNWLRLTRSGSTFTAFVSADGAAWTQVGTPQAITTSNTVLVGLATSSGTDGSYVNAVYDTLTVTETGMTSSITPALTDWSVAYTYFPPPTAGELSCASCHNVHFVQPGSADQSVATNWWQMERVSNPNNTKTNYSGTHRDGGATSFCLECHDGAAPTTAANDANTLVPYNVSFTSPLAPFFPGWNKQATGADWANSAHNLSAVQQMSPECSSCHDPHGSNNARLTALTAYIYGTTNASHVDARRDDATAYAEEGLCYACHTNDTTPNCAGGACHGGGTRTVALINVQTAFGGTYRHPVATAGEHSDTETGADLGPAGNRHAECADCHDPHAARNGVHPNTTSATAATKSSNPGEALRGATGIVPVYPAVAFTGAPGEVFEDMNSAASFTSERMTGDAADFEAYVCLKCHSGYSGQPFALTAAQGNGRAYTSTDLALEFNPSNQGEHNVFGQSVGMEGSFMVNGTVYAMPLPADSAFLKTGWTHDSPVTCTDCHTNTTAGAARGPHGSSTPWLIATGYVTWTTSTNLSNLNTPIGTNYVICTKCHQNLSSSNAAHAEHDNRATCMNCHIKVPHGWKRPRLLVSSNDPAYLSSNGRIGQGIALRNRSGPNDWQDESVDCAGGCDGRHNYSGTFWP